MSQSIGRIWVWLRKPHGEVKAIDYVFALLDIPWWYYAIASILATVVCWKWRWEGGLLIGYTFLVIAITLLTRKSENGTHFQPELFWSWRQWNSQKGQIIANIVMFIPIGVLAGRLWKWKGLWFAVGLSFVIELLQLVMSRGLCEFDDVFHNCIGAAAGIGIVMFAGKRFKKWNS